MRTSKLLHTCAAACLLAAGAASGQMIKPGLIAPGLGIDGENQSISDVYSVRYIFDQNKMDLAMDNGPGEDHFTALMDAWTVTNCVEVVMALRNEHDGPIDRVPANAADRTTALNRITNFITEHGHYFTHVQVGNEIFAGAGRYEVNVGGVWYAWADVTDSTSQYWLDPVFEWMQDIADTVEAAAAASGYAITVVSPSATANFVDSAAGAPGKNRSGLQRTVTFGNQSNYLTSVHLHRESLTQLQGTVNNFMAFGPARPTCMEWTPAEAAGDWLSNPVHLMELISMYAGVSQVAWDQFTADWLLDLGLDLDSFMAGSLAAMDANGFEHGLYGQAVQSGGPTDPKKFDMTSTLAQNTIIKLVSQSQLSTHFVNAYEAAAAAYHRRTLCDTGSQ